LCSTAAEFPRVNGHQLLCQALSLKEKLRVLFISSHSYDSLAPQGMTIEPDQFLHKPFSVESLLTRVAGALAAPPISPDHAKDAASPNDAVQWVD
jgi:DNA-binding response OmpR family regulator